MASGDVFVNYGLIITAGSVVNIQPAVGVQVMITTVLTNTTAGIIVFQGNLGAISGNGVNNNNASLGAIQPIYNAKYFCTNTQYIGLSSTAGTTSMGYSGIEL